MCDVIYVIYVTLSNDSCLLYAALPFIANFTAGAIAGVSEILTFYPLGDYDRLLHQSCILIFVIS